MVSSKEGGGADQAPCPRGEEFGLEAVLEGNGFLEK